MNDASKVVRMDAANDMLKLSFLRWQCRLRQIAVRENQGRPGEGMMPAVRLASHEPVLGHVVTVLCKAPAFAKTMELKHMVRQTQDVAARRDSALKFLGELYYQKAKEFSDTLTATFAPSSSGAEELVRNRTCILQFAQFSQSYTLHCRVRRLSANNPLRDATFWHNVLFNPNLSARTEILGFEPLWAESSADPWPV